MSAETWWIVGCIVVGAIGLWLVLRGRRQTAVVGGDQAPSPPKPITDLDRQVRELAASGDKIAAIKLIRKQTGWKLKRAKDYVDSLPNAAPIYPVMVNNPTAPALRHQQEIRDKTVEIATREGKIQAVKFVRESTGRDLANAKTYVEEVLRGSPPQPVAGPVTAETLDPDLRQQAIALVAQEKSIDAIKLVRERTGLGLAEAADVVRQLPVTTPKEGLHAMFATVSIDEMANSVIVRGSIKRAIKRGYPESQLVAEIVRTTGRSEADVRALIARVRGPGPSPIE